MNRKIGIYSSILNTAMVIGFAITMLLASDFSSYLVSMFIAFSFVVMMASYCFYSKPEKKVAGYAALGFAAIYAVLILLVYFAQLTTVHQGGLNEQARSLLDFQQYGLIFNYDLLGYGVMALATFFAGLTVETTSKADQWLKWLLLIHGVFFFSCLIIPMLGVFSTDSQSSAWVGVAVLEFWCLYFAPIGILSAMYFKKQE